MVAFDPQVSKDENRYCWRYCRMFHVRPPLAPQTLVLLRACLGIRRPLQIEHLDDWADVVGIMVQELPIVGAISASF
jgi:hypothetical protein